MKNKKYLYTAAIIFVISAALLVICKAVPKAEIFKASLLDYVCNFAALPLAYILGPALLAYIIPSLKNRKLAVICLALSIASVVVYAAASVHVLASASGNNIAIWFHNNVWCWIITGVLLTLGVNGMKVDK